MPLSSTEQQSLIAWCKRWWGPFLARIARPCRYGTTTVTGGDATAVNLLSGEHVVLTLPAGFDASFPLANVPVPAGLATGAWHFEGTVLEAALGRTFDREVRVFEINP